ncbi:MAG: hypothetical protein RLZZ32_1730 [Cyanobacteriota bacterium]
MPSLSRSAWSWPLTLMLTGAPWAPVARGAEVVVPVPSPYSYDDASLRQLQVHRNEDTSGHSDAVAVRHVSEPGGNTLQALVSAAWVQLLPSDP